MKSSVIELLACPVCQGCLVPVAPIAPEIDSGTLKCERCAATFPIVRGIPRFVPSDDYVSSFSFEWRRFARTQLDSANGFTESESRFRQSLNFPLEELAGKRVLDAGCGMGRFAEIAAKYGATVVGVDMSYAVEPAATNLARWPDVSILQADLRQLPLKTATFDLVYSLGVLHHTPNAREAFATLLPYVKPGGQISITLYSGYNRIYVASTNAWRIVTTRLPKKLVYYFSHLAIPAYYVYKTPFLGLIGKALWPICEHPNKEWRVLDTLDCYTPAYQSFHSHPEVFRWFKEAGLEDIEVLEPGISFIARRPLQAAPKDSRGVRL